MEVEPTNLTTFEEWYDRFFAGYDGQEVGNRAWIRVGDWLLNAKENDAYREERVGYHICRGNYERLYARELGLKRNNSGSSVSDIEEACGLCGEAMPDGIKMIALLEKL